MELVHELLSVYQRNGFAVVNFLYFANAMQFHLFEQRLQNIKDRQYSEALLKGDFLLPDGIALQLWAKRTEKKTTHNLNGTDLTPLFLQYLNDHEKASLYIYSLYDPKIDKGPEWLWKAVEKLHESYPQLKIVFTHQSLYAQRWEQFPRRKLEECVEEDDSHMKVFLHCTGTPFQELWVEENRAFFEKNHLLVMNVGGFIDFVAGFEIRAPKWVVKARILETFWRIATNPRKNLKKFLAMFGIWRILLQKLRLKNS